MQTKIRRSIVLVTILVGVAIVTAVASAASWRRTSRINAFVDGGVTAAAAGDTGKAETNWHNAIALDPANPRTYEMLAQYEMSAGRWQEAADAFRGLAKAAPKTPHIDCRLAACLLRQGDQKGAFDTASKEIKRDPNCVAALGLVTSIMVLQPESDEKLRLEYMRRLTTLAPSDVDFLHMYAEELTNEYRYEDMRPIAMRILAADPNDAEAYNLLGYADLASPRQPEGVKMAQQDFSHSLAINPANGGAHFGLGRAALRLGNAKEAVANLETALSMRPDAARINYELSTAYRMAGDNAKADAAKNRFLAWQQVNAEHRQLQVRCIAFPKDAQYPKRLGLLLVQSNGDPAEALYYLKKAKELAPGDKTVAAALQHLDANSRASSRQLTASVDALPNR